MKRRDGTTLVEVLIAIFVMGIGLLALLTLFPLGALNMANAIRDGRTAHAAANAEAIALAKGIRWDASVGNSFQDPGGGFPVLGNISGYEGPSYPVYVDPFGYYSALGQASVWVSGNFAANYGVPRRSVSFVRPASLNYDAPRWFSLLDDITFEQNGLPDITSGEVQREGAYSWAYLLRRPHAQRNSVVDLSVVIYNQRPLRLTTGVNPNEFAFAATFDLVSQTVTLTWNAAAGQSRPSIKPGGWILDATIETINAMPRPHGFFYRVTDVTEIGPNSIELQVASNFREFARSPQQQAGVVIILEGVSEVFERSTGWKQ